MTPRASIFEAIVTAESRVPAVLRALKSAHRLTDANIAAAMGMTRSAVQARMTGATQCSPGELAGFALLYGVPVALFYETDWLTPPTITKLPTDQYVTRIPVECPDMSRVA